MIVAPSIEQILKEKRRNPKAICCILFAPKFVSSGFNNIISRFGYLDKRTGENLNVYCIGYGSYWNDEYAPDREDAGIVKHSDGEKINVQFSQEKFAECVEKLEEITSWKYSGGTELILLNSDFDFSNCIIFRIDEMIKDGIIDFPGELFEALVRISRKEENSITKLSINGITKLSLDNVFESIVNCLPKQFNILNKLWKNGKHYSIVNLK